MKHRAMTPLRWLRRLPGRAYRSKGARFFVGGIIGYQIAFQIAWRLAGKPDQDVMTAFAWIVLISAYVALTVVTFVLRRQGKKYWHEGHDAYDYALATLTMVTHGRYNASKDENADEYDVSCQCGTYLGAVKMMTPEDVLPLLEEHTNKKIEDLKAEVERKTGAVKV